MSLGEEAARRAVTLTGASKAWNIPGLKCGLIVAGSSAMKRELDRVSKLLRDQTGLFGVLGSTAAFREGGPWLEELLGYLDGNRRYLADAIPERLPGVGQLAPFPDGPTGFLRPFLSGWRWIGLGTRSSPPAAFGLLGLSGGLERVRSSRGRAAAESAHRLRCSADRGRSARAR